MPSRLSYVWLSLKRGLGSRTAAEVLDAFGSPEAVFAADRQALTAAPCELRKTHVDLLCDKDTSEAEQVIRSCMEKNIQIITIGDSAYPDRLRAIPDPPTVLYVRGRWPDFDSVPAVAVVGTRKATPYGLKVADQIGTTLARAGMITVSGMALGNDGAAHRGALKAGGLTIAVLAGGPNVCYPPQHRSLMGDILLMGAIISEYPPGTEPHGRNYHQRNRIISGLSVASVIVEASDWRSGALITARHALDQGRDVYAVPGPIDAPQSQSCNELIAKGEVRVTKPRIGGGFGAKQTAVSAVYPAFVTWMTKKPSKIIFSRVESQIASSPRHEMEMHVRLGANKDGIVRGIDLHTLSNTGAGRPQ